MLGGITKALTARAVKAKMSCSSMIVVVKPMAWARLCGYLIEYGRRTVEERGCD
jgi:hypothetical protein